MKEQNHKMNAESELEKFIKSRAGLSSFDRKLEAAKLINHTNSVDVETACKKVSSKISGTKASRSFFTALTRVAAILTLPLLAFAVWSLFFQEEQSEEPVLLVQNEITWQEIYSPLGMRSFVVLPDGTNLWLNAGSRLRYGIPFTRERREVELSGEAFIDVKENEQSPFVVKAQNAEVEVLGTQFNVNAYSDAEQIQVALKEGKVKFLFDGDSGAKKYCELNPNDLLAFNKKSKTVTRANTNIEKYIAWHQNIMILDDTPMTEVARLMERWYGVKVIIKDESIKKYRFTTVFDNEPLFRVLELLELSSPKIKTTYIPGKPDDETKKLSQSIVTITKNKRL
ncbi:FecR family protein [Mariniphaga anaerophila]|nr:FecR domain-containing protein [Mariniphaga anaerophila]